MAKSITMQRPQSAALIVVSLAIFTDMLVYSLVVPILPHYTLTLGASQAAIGFLFASYSIALFIATPIWGLLSDRVGRRGPLLTGLLGLATATLLFAFADSFPMLVLARALQGISAAATWTAGLALLADVFPAAERGRAMGLALSSQAVGTLLGPSLGGWLYQWGGYRLPFFVATALALIDGGVRLALLRDKPRLDAPRQASPFTLLGNPLLLFIALVVVIGALVPSLLEPTLPLHLEAVMQASPLTVGLLFGVPTLAYAVAAPLVGPLAVRYGAIHTMLVGLVLLAASLPLLALPSSIWLEALVLAILGISLGVVLTPTLTELAAVAERQQTGSYGAVYAVYNTAYSVGMLLGPLGGGIMTEAFGLLSVLLLVSGAVLLYTLVMAGATRRAYSLKGR